MWKKKKSRDLESEGYEMRKNPPAITGVEVEGDHELRNVAFRIWKRTKKKKKKGFFPRASRREHSTGDTLILAQ